MEKLAAIGVVDVEVNIRNKLSRGKFTAAFFMAMLRSYWSVVGVCLALASGPVFGQEQPEPNPSTQPSKSSSESSRPPFPIVVIQSDDDAAHEHEREQSADQHDAADLLAQQQAASAAEVSATASKGQLGPVWAGVILSAVAAILSVGALVFSIVTANRADRTSRAELRAYLGIDTITVKVAPDSSSISVNAGVKNYGQTPATDVLIQSGWACEAPPFRPEWVNRPDGTEDDVSNSRMGPGAIVYLSHSGGEAETNVDRRITKEALAKAADEDGIGFWFHGAILYQDIFGRRYVAEFRYKLGKMPDGGPSLAATKDGNFEQEDKKHA